MLQVYFFNLTNPKAVFDGVEKPKLVEVSTEYRVLQWQRVTHCSLGWALHLPSEVVETERDLAQQWDYFLQD